MENKKLIVGLVLIFIISLGIYLFIRNGCVSSITYIPKSETPMGRGSVTKIEGHYRLFALTKDYSSINGDFKTRNEAISYCMSRKFGLGD